MTRTEPFYIKFDKINEMLKNTTDHTTRNVCKMMLEAGFQVNDTFVAVCDEENGTYAGIYPNVEWAKSEAREGNHIEGTKRLMKDDDYDEEYYWEITGDTLKVIEEIGGVELWRPVEYDSIKKTIWFEPFMFTINNCPSEEQLDPDLIDKAMDLKESGIWCLGSYAIDYNEITK